MGLRPHLLTKIMPFNEYEKEIKNENDNFSISIQDAVNTANKAIVDASGALKVTGGGGGFEVLDGTAANLATDLGSILAGYDGSNYQFLSVDSDGQLQVDVQSLPNVNLASQTSPFTDDINVSLDGETVGLSSQLWPFTDDAPVTLDGEQVDISDRSARDLGKVDIAAFDVALPSGDNNIGNVDIVTMPNIVLASQASPFTDDINVSLDSEQVDISDRAVRDVGKIRLIDANGVALDVAKDATRPANTRSLLISGLDESDVVRVPTVVEDSEDGKYRLEIAGKVYTSPPEPPAATTPVTLNGSTTLDLSGTDSTDYTIPNGETFTLTQVIAGAEGDPTEKGSKVEVYYVDSSSVEHIISRIYITGFTEEIYPNTSYSRDGTLMSGDGTNTKIRIKREHFGGGTRELDAVARGYY